MARWFKGLKTAPHSRPIIAFDIEGCGGQDGFVCGAVEGEVLSNFFTDPGQMLDALLEYGRDGAWLFSHNLEYDLPILAGARLWSGEMLFSKYGLLWVTYQVRGRSVKFYDSLNLFPRYSVKSLGEMISYPKGDPGPGILDRLGRGDRWSSFTPEQQRQIERYCRRDAEIIQRAVADLQDTLNSLGGQLRPTLPGCAMDLYRRAFHKWPWMTVPPNTNELARHGYYGGRVENFVVGKVESVNMYDVTSLYPYVQSQVKFPLPNKLKLDVLPRLTGSWLSWDGVASAFVDIPADFIPPLPVRKSNRLFFPTGRVQGVWPLIELRNALDNGCDLLGVEWVLGSETIFNPFTRFVEELFRVRQGYLAEGNSRSNIIKLILNGLYGRFGLDPKDSLARVVPLTPETDWDKLAGYVTKEIGNRTVAYGPIQNTRYPDYVNVLFAAQISGAARVYLFDVLKLQDQLSIYCDTDAIITRGQLEESPGLGGWRAQMLAGSADLLGPKEYSLHNSVLGTRYVAKGIPDAQAAEYLKTGYARFRRAVGVRESLSGDQMPATWTETFRSRRYVVPKREVIDPSYLSRGDWSATRPFAVGELESLLAPVAGLDLPDW